MKKGLIRRMSRGLPCACLALLAAGGAAAGEGLRLSGFGTFGYAADNHDNIAPVRDISQLPRDGFSTGASWRLDSRLGVQLEYAATPDLDIVGQFVLRDQFRGDAGSSTEFAYLGYRPNAHWSLRAGRVNYDAFLMSDHRSVGYAYLWVRPPTEFYGWIPIMSVDGADAAYDFEAGDARWRIKAQAGNSKLSIPIGNGYEFRAQNLVGLSLTRQTATWRLKAAYSQFTIGSEAHALTPLHNGLSQVAAAGIPGISAEAADLRRELSFEDTRVSYGTLGAAYDDGVWLAQAELGVSTATHDVVPHARMAYVSVGRRFGDWTPYVMAGVSRPGNDLRQAVNNWGGFNATLRDPALYTLNTTRMEQDTLSLGVRWDLHRQAALKLQLDSTAIRPSGYGLWWRDSALNNRSSRVNMLSATLDFVF